MIMVLLFYTHKRIIYYIIKRERENIAVFSVSTDKSLSYSFLDMLLISGYRIIPLLYHVIKNKRITIIWCVYILLALSVVPYTKAL